MSYELPLIYGREYVFQDGLNVYKFVFVADLQQKDPQGIKQQKSPLNQLGSLWEPKQKPDD